MGNWAPNPSPCGSNPPGSPLSPTSDGGFVPPLRVTLCATARRQKVSPHPGRQSGCGQVRVVNHAVRRANLVRAPAAGGTGSGSPAPSGDCRGADGPPAWSGPAVPWQGCRLWAMCSRFEGIRAHRTSLQERRRPCAAWAGAAQLFAACCANRCPTEIPPQMECDLPSAERRPLDASSRRPARALSPRNFSEIIGDRRRIRSSSRGTVFAIDTFIRTVSSPSASSHSSNMRSILEHQEGVWDFVLLRQGV